MEKLKNFGVFDFSKGMARNKSPLALEDNELVLARNVDLGEQGRIKKRTGSLQFGDTIGSEEIRGILPYYEEDFDTDLFMVTDDGSANSDTYRLISTQLDGAVAAGATSLTVDSTTGFDSSGTIEVNGDLITYTGTDATHFTGCSGVAVAHADNSYIHQWDSSDGDAFADEGGSGNGGTDGGVTYTQLDNGSGTAELYINAMCSGSNTGRMWNGSAWAGQGQALLKGVQAIYNAKRFSMGTDRGSVRFSAVGDGDDFSSATNNFEVGLNDGEFITAMIPGNDELYFFKPTKAWVYNEYTLRPLEKDFGAYNHSVVRKVAGNIFTFCPLGVFMFNGREAQRISDPIKEYLDDYTPSFNDPGSTTLGTVVKNTYAMGDDTKYYLYLEGTLGPTDEQLTDPVFVYDIRTQSWTAYEYGQKIRSFEPYTETTGGISKKDILFGNDGGKVFKINAGSADDLTTPISSEVIFKAFHLDSPNTFKRFGQLRVLSERSGFNVFYKIDDEDWQALGEATKDNQVFQFPNNTQGYRCQLKISDNTTQLGFIFNGFIFEDTYGITDTRRGK